MIKISNLEFAYPAGDFWLQVEDLSVDAGEQVAVIGPSGSGKTTLLHLVAGILSPGSGTITVNQSDLTDLSEAARRNFRIANIGLVFQEFELIEYLNVRDNIMLPYRINHSLAMAHNVRDRVEALARDLEVSDKLRRFPGQLSQGEKQRVAICRALITEPKLVLADEPTGNLDPANKARVIDLLLDYAAGQDVSVLMVTHDHGVLDRFSRTVDFEEFRKTQHVA